MARRKRIGIVSIERRMKEFEKALPAGEAKWSSKSEETMIQHARGGLAFTYELDKLINGVLARRGIFGQRAIKYYILGRRLAKLIVGFSDRPDEALAAAAEEMIMSYAVQENIDVDVAHDIAAELLRRKDYLREVYGIG